MKLKYFFILCTTVFILFSPGCGKKGGNPVVNYLNNSELKYDNKMKRDVVMQAARDVTMLSSDDLKNERYTDDNGKERQWNLQQLFTQRFIPKKSGLTWGDDFYHDVKADSVLAIMGYILVTY